MASFTSFEELECWKEAVVLRKQIRIKIRSFQVEEKYKLIDQLKRATRSVTANIAEGFGRYHSQENSQFCRHSRGSLHEIIDHLIVANEEGYLTDNELNELKQQTLKCIAILNGYINYLQKAKINTTKTNNK
ncbi:four helix bundle protein [Aurantibacillus circumpalustris]|uniref:four helix bundle protein n=1 Tax=Aurantibacillus circumpalustris TaxID=3036359 RepID=UPI00295B36F3|nr:four helix bundle protein [Aurantibacillus circumpalustris]